MQPHTHKTLVLLVSTVVFLSFAFSFVHADISTAQSFNLQFTSGSAFQIQDEYTTYLFTVSSGNLTGTGTLTVIGNQGTFIINAGGSCSLQVTWPSTWASSVKLNGATYVFNNAVSLSNGQTVTFTWVTNPVPTVPIYRFTATQTLYFRSDSQTNLNVTANRLASSESGSVATSTTTANGQVTVNYGFRVWLVTSSSATTELTSGSPVGIISLSSATNGKQNSQYTFNGNPVIFGYQALEVVIYTQQGSGQWTATNTFISDVLLTDNLEPTYWQFNLYVNYAYSGDVTTCSYSFGSGSAKSNMQIAIQAPTEPELQNWRLERGDYMGFIIGAYADIIGVGAFYAIVLLMICAVLYFRYGHAGTVLVFFGIFGGTGGLVFVFLPLWAASVVGLFLVLVCAGLLWRVLSR